MLVKSSVQKQKAGSLRWTLTSVHKGKIQHSALRLIVDPSSGLEATRGNQTSMAPAPQADQPNDLAEGHPSWQRRPAGKGSREGQHQEEWAWEASTSKRGQVRPAPAGWGGREGEEVQQEQGGTMPQVLVHGTQVCPNACILGRRVHTLRHSRQAPSGDLGLDMLLCWRLFCFSSAVFVGRYSYVTPS
eukprot:550915-Pelagomonas_calceolata.AAC.1